MTGEAERKALCGKKVICSLPRVALLLVYLLYSTVPRSVSLLLLMSAQPLLKGALSSRQTPPVCAQLPTNWAQQFLSRGLLTALYKNPCLHDPAMVYATQGYMQQLRWHTPQSRGHAPGCFLTRLFRHRQHRPHPEAFLTVQHLGGNI